MKIDPPAPPLRYRSPSQIARTPAQTGQVPAASQPVRHPTGQVPVTGSQPVRRPTGQMPVTSQRPRHQTGPVPEASPADAAGSALRLLPVALGLAVVAGAFFVGRATATRAPEALAAEADRGSDRAGEPRGGAETASGRLAERLRALGGTPAFARAGGGPVGQEALETLNRLPSSELREEERVRMIEQWATTAPEAALDYARQNLRGERQTQAIDRIATIWAKRAPAEAWQWARKQGAGGTHRAQLVMEEVARNAPATAARFATEFARQEPQEARAMALVAIRGMTYDGSFDAARRFVTDLHLASPEDQVALTSALAEQWGRHDPEQAMAWARGLSEGPGRTQALASLGDAWAEADPARATVFAEQLPAGQARQVALQQAVSHWNLTDPSALNDWITHATPNPDFDQAVASLASQHGASPQRTEQLFAWASAIGDPSLRLSTMRDIVSDWAVRDRNAALSFVQSSPRLSPDTRGALLAQIGR